MDNQFALVATRVLGFSLFFPAFSLIRIPISVRVAFAASLCILLGPYYQVANLENLLFSEWSSSASYVNKSVALAGIQSGTSLAAVVIEFGIGLLLALVCGLVFFSAAALASWLGNLICSSWDETDYQKQLLGLNQLPTNVLVALCLLIGAGVFNRLGVDQILMPLIKSFSVSPVNLTTSATTYDSLLSLVSIGGFALQFSLLLAVPFVLVIFLLDVVNLLVHRLCRPLVSPTFAHTLRGIVLITALSLGALYVEFSSVEHAGRWSSDVLDSSEFK